MLNLTKIKHSDTIYQSMLSDLIKEIFTEFYIDIFPKEHLDYILDFSDEKTIQDEIKIDKKEYYFIEINNKIIGFLGCYQENKKINICDLYLKKQYRQKGYGSKVINKLKENTLIEELRIKINKNLKDVLSFFIKHNFKKDKQIATYIGNGYFNYETIYTCKI